jgi:hypothetical protein
MKDAEDEAFDDLAKRQGDWGSGFQAKRQMAADKFCDAHCVWTDHHPDCKMAADKQEPAQENWREFASDYERGFIDGMQKQAQSSVDKAVNQMAQPAQEPDLTAVYMSGLYDGKKKKRPWVGLTDEEIKEIVGPYGDMPIKGYTRKLFDQIEAKLRSKNT